VALGGGLDGPAPATGGWTAGPRPAILVVSLRLSSLRR
jgi:hypothetical protein